MHKHTRHCTILYSTCTHINTALFMHACTHDNRCDVMCCHTASRLSYMGMFANVNVRKSQTLTMSHPTHTHTHTLPHTHLYPGLIVVSALLYNAWVASLGRGTELSGKSMGTLEHLCLALYSEVDSSLRLTDLKNILSRLMVIKHRERENKQVHYSAKVPLKLPLFQLE